MPDRLATRTAALVLLGACVAGCTGASVGASAPVPASSPSVASSASIEVSVPADVLDPIVADAATRASVDPSAVTVTGASARTWPNGALGCPTPGVMYTQAVVSGWQVVVEAGGTPYDYRASGPGRFRLCASGPGSNGSPGGSGAPG